MVVRNEFLSEDGEMNLECGANVHHGDILD